MTDELFYLLQDVEVLSSFIPVIFLILTKSKTRRDLRRVLYLNSIAWMLAECISWLLSRNGFGTFLVFHIYSSISTVGYLLLFHLAIPEWLSKKLMITIGVTFLAVQWGVILYSGGYFETSTVGMALTSIIPFILSLLAFYSIAKKSKYPNLISEPLYWIISAILIHFALALVALFSLEYLSHNGNVLIVVWPLVLFSNMIHNIIISIGIWKTNRI